MTGPILHGYPDWGRQTAPSDVSLIDNLSINMAAPSNFGDIFVGLAPYVQLVARNNPGNRARLELAWYKDAAFTSFLYSEFVHLGSSGSYRGSLTVAAPYLRVTGSAAAYPQALTIDMIIGVAPRRQFEESGSVPILVHRVATAVGAGATVTVDASTTVLGRATWSARSALATYVARLQAIDMAGNAWQLAAVDNAINSGPCQVWLPAMPVRVSFTNTTGADGTFDSSVVCQVSEP